VAESDDPDYWAGKVSPSRYLSDWRAFAESLDDYPGNIDDYTHDMLMRDSLVKIIERAKPADQTVIQDELDEIDAIFTSRTIDDEGYAVGHYSRRPSDPGAGWWWKRRPPSGRLGEYLDHP